MESYDIAAISIGDLLDFSEDDDLNCEKTRMPSSFSLFHSCPLSEYVEEEELEWISNKDAFPMVESFVHIMPNQSTTTNTASTATPPSHHRGLVSVLENSSTSSINSTTSSSGSSSRNTSCSAVSDLISTFKVPGKGRTKMGRKPRQDMLGQQWRCWPKPAKKVKVSCRKCLHCQSEKTPQWRAGPLGPKTLCNACGVRYMSGRLVPEYRPASSPTFSSVFHSNSHRKIVEMRKQKMMTMTMPSNNGANS